MDFALLVASRVFGGGNDGPVILLSANSISESAASGSTVGALSVIRGDGVYTFSITLDADNKFAIDGTDLETDAALDFGTAESHLVTIEADNGVDDPISRIFTISVIEAVSSGALLLESGDYLLLESGDNILLEAA